MVKNLSTFESRVRVGHFIAHDRDGAYCSTVPTKHAQSEESAFPDSQVLRVPHHRRMMMDDDDTSTISFTVSRNSSNEKLTKSDILNDEYVMNESSDDEDSLNIENTWTDQLFLLKTNRQRMI